MIGRSSACVRLTVFWWSLMAIGRSAPKPHSSLLCCGRMSASKSSSSIRPTRACQPGRTGGCVCSGLSNTIMSGKGPMLYMGRLVRWFAGRSCWRSTGGRRPSRRLGDLSPGRAEDGGADQSRPPAAAAPARPNRGRSSRVDAHLGDLPWMPRNGVVDGIDPAVDAARTGGRHAQGVVTCCLASGEI